MAIDRQHLAVSRRSLSGSGSFELLEQFRLSTPDKTITIRGDAHDRDMPLLGGPTGAKRARLCCPFTSCWTYIAEGSFPPLGGRKFEQGIFEIDVMYGLLSLVCRDTIRQVALPSGEYSISGRMYTERDTNYPDFVVLIKRVDGIQVKLLTA